MNEYKIQINNYIYIFVLEGKNGFYDKCLLLCVNN